MNLKFNHFLFIPFISFALLFNSCSSSEVEIIDTDLIPSQHDFVSAELMNTQLSRGINIGNALEAPDEGAWGLVIKEEYFSLIKNAGFNSVRIPIRWSAHTDDSTPYDIDDAFLYRVHEVVNQALNQDLIVIINIHHFNELMDEPAQHKQKFLRIWKQLSSSFKDYSQNVLFKVLNEPHSNLTREKWNTYLNDAINTIRETNPRRVLLAGTAPWGGFDGIHYLDLPQEDRQIIATVHYYNPFQFTHQGAEWVGEEADEWLGTTWTATPEQQNQINSDFIRVQEWSEQNQRPVHVGEFGAYSKAPEASRAMWTEYVRKAAESRNFSWAYWEFGSGFGIYDPATEQWRKKLLNALINDD